MVTARARLVAPRRIATMTSPPPKIACCFHGNGNVPSPARATTVVNARKLQNKRCLVEFWLAATAASFIPRPRPRRNTCSASARDLLSAGVVFAVSCRAGGRDAVGTIRPYKFLESYDQTRACVSVLMLLSAVALPTWPWPSELGNEKFNLRTARAFPDL